MGSDNRDDRMDQQIDSDELSNRQGEPRDRSEESQQSARSGEPKRPISGPAANRADWANAEGGGSREDARERARDGESSADTSPPGGSVGGTGAQDTSDHRHHRDE